MADDAKLVDPVVAIDAAWASLNVMYRPSILQFRRLTLQNWGSISQEIHELRAFRDKVSTRGVSSTGTNTK